MEERDAEPACAHTKLGKPQPAGTGMRWPREIVATALAEYLLCQEHGTEKVRNMIVDDIRQAQVRGDRNHVLALLHVLHHFLKTHPEAKPSQHPWSKRF